MSSSKEKDWIRLGWIYRFLLALPCLIFLFFSYNSSVESHSNNSLGSVKNDFSATSNQLRYTVYPHHPGEGDVHDNDNVYQTTDFVESLAIEPKTTHALDYGTSNATLASGFFLLPGSYDAKFGPQDEVPAIFVGALTVSSSTQSSTVTLQKNQCRPVIDCGDIVEITSYPDPADDLTFIQPVTGTVFHHFLEETKEFVQHLIEHDALYIPGNHFEDEMIFDSVLMSRREGAGTYYVRSLMKIGRTTKLKRAKQERYPNVNGVTTVFYDGLPNNVISPMTGKLHSLYNVISSSFADDGGLSNFLLTKTIYDAATWEGHSGGLSIYSAIDLHMTTQSIESDPYFGGVEGFRRGTEKAWHLNQMESSQQLLWSGHTAGPAVENGIAHEHLHSNLHTSFVIENDRRVTTNLQHFKSVLEDITGRQLYLLTFLPLTHLASWEPGQDFFSLSTLNSILLSVGKLVVGDGFDLTSFDSLSDDQLRQIVDNFGDDIGCELSISSEWASFGDVVTTAFHSCRPDDVFVFAKESMYDTLASKLNSRLDHFWDDPFRRQTDRDLGAYNAKDNYSPSDRQQAREVNLRSIQSLKMKTDSCTDVGNVHYVLMDTNYEAYRHENFNLEQDIREQGFTRVHIFSQLKVFVYQSQVRTTDCCIGLLFLHRPLHRALESRPPWVQTSFGLEDWQTFGETAVTFHWLHSAMMTFRGEKSDFDTPKGMTESILPAHALHLFLSKRLHVGDLRVSALKGKALLLRKKSRGLLNTSFMKVKCLNRFCREHGHLATYFKRSFTDRLFRHISASSKDVNGIVDDVYGKMLAVSKDDNNEKDLIVTYIHKLRKSYFRKSSSFINALISKHDKYWESKLSVNKKNAENERKRQGAFLAQMREKKRKNTL